jgi:hypothetical protein
LPFGVDSRGTRLPSVAAAASGAASIRCRFRARRACWCGRALRRRHERSPVATQAQSLGDDSAKCRSGCEMRAALCSRWASIKPITAMSTRVRKAEELAGATTRAGVTAIASVSSLWWSSLDLPVELASQTTTTKGLGGDRFFDAALASFRAKMAVVQRTATSESYIWHTPYLTL